MTTAESMLGEFDEEMASTRRILERVPDGKTDWTPHAKSTPLARLATHLAEIGQVHDRVSVRWFGRAERGGRSVPR